MGRRFSRHGGWRTTATPYRSGLEDNIAEQLNNAGIMVVYESYKLRYTIPESEHIYTPDFILPNGIIIEAKGIFDVKDRQKHLLIRKQYPHLDIRFVFSNPRTKISYGAKTTLADWCNKYGFKYAAKSIPPNWFKEKEKNLEGLEEAKNGND